MNNLKTYLRFLLKNKALTLINVLGLSLGISSCIFITLFVSDELSYDRHNDKFKQIYRLSTKFSSQASIDHAPLTSLPLPQELMKFPEIEQVVRFDFGARGEYTVKYGDVMFREKGIWQADSNIFKVFTHHFVAGNPETALLKPKSVVLSRRIAEKYFGTDDPLGKTLRINRDDYDVTGVIEEQPSASDFRYNMLTSMDRDDFGQDWFNFDYVTYILVNQKSQESSNFQSMLETKINTITEEKVNKALRKETTEITASTHLQSLDGLHFEKPLLYDTPKGNIDYVYIFSLVALLILFIGCLNYVNFSIAQSIERSKEVGIRKVNGATFVQLMMKYLNESFALSFVSLLIACAAVILLLPQFNEIAGKDFSVSDFLNLKILLMITGILLVVGVLAGAYPAFYTSSLKAIDSMKGKLSSPKGQFIRKSSVTMQFMISIGLIITTAIVFEQMSFIQQYDLGFRKDNVISISTPDDSLSRDKVRTFSEKLRQNSFIEIISIGSWGSMPGSSSQRGSATLKADGKESVRMLNFSHVDEHYIPLMNISVVEGRNFDGGPGDKKNSILVNESLVKMMGWKNPVGNVIGDRTIIGVVRDYHYNSLYNKVEPLVITSKMEDLGTVFASFNGSDFSNKLSRIEEEWRSVFPDEPFIYKFLDDAMRLQYEKEEKAMRIFAYFAGLTILISCFGLFGLSSLTVYQKRKEIGIRKVIGASVKSILMLFSKEYLTLIAAAFIVIAPIAWYVMNRWLETFPFRTSVAFPVFIGVGVAVILISLATIYFSILKIVRSSPTDLMGER